MLSNLARLRPEEPELTDAQSLNIPLSVAPIISGLLLVKWIWPFIFSFLSMASPLVFWTMFSFLLETSRGLVRSGSGRTSCVNTSLTPTPRPERDSMSIFREEGQKEVPKLPNPLSVLLVLKVRATLAAVLCYGIYCTVHSCLQASTYTLCITIYRLSGLLAGLIYIPLTLLAL